MEPEYQLLNTRVVAKGKAIASSVWGRAWCLNLERYSHYMGRLPQGRTLLRRGAVSELQITAGRVDALVEDERSHEVTIRVQACSEERWAQLQERCGDTVDSLLDLLQGKLSASVMAVMTDPENGLFPEPSELRCVCTCIDEADLCKHAAAALYGVAVAFDDHPELLFLLRQVDAGALVKADMTGAVAGTLDEGALEGIFGFELDVDL